MKSKLVMMVLGVQLSFVAIAQASGTFGRAPCPSENVKCSLATQEVGVSVDHSFTEVFFTGTDSQYAYGYVKDASSNTGYRWIRVPLVSAENKVSPLIRALQESFSRGGAGVTTEL